MKSGAGIYGRKKDRTEPSRSLPARCGPIRRSPGRKRSDLDRRTAGPVRRGIHRAGRAAARRKPRLLFRFSGSFLLRFAGRQFLGSLFQLPPRMTRFEALAVHRKRL